MASSRRTARGPKSTKNVETVKNEKRKPRISPSAMPKSVNFEPQTKNQELLIKSIKNNKIIFAVGYPGTGKTFIAIAEAINALLRGDCEKIIITRPAVVSGPEIGFLPGTDKEKQDPYMAPLYEAFHKLLPSALVEQWIDDEKIIVKPIAFLRGTNFENSYVICDEVENADRKVFYLLMSRVCTGSKLIFSGDSGQCDLRKANESGLEDAVGKFENVKGFGVVRFNVNDCLRDPIVQEVIKAYFPEA